MPKGGRLAYVVFIVAGSLALLGALYACLRTRSFIRTAAPADGVVVRNIYQHSNRGRGTYFPRVRFHTSSGQQLTLDAHFGTNPPSYHAGEHVPVLYDPGDPTHFSIDAFWSLWFVPVLAGGMGLLFCTIGLLPFAWQRHVERRDDWLRLNGQRIFADFDRVELNTSVRVNGRHPWRIVCQRLDPASKQVRVYRSHNLWFDPAKYITGKTLEVMIDPANPKRYVVETSFLPKLAE